MTFKSRVYMALTTFIYIVSFAVPKKKNLFVFGAWQGKLYADNTRYLFEHISKNHKDVKCVWISNDPQVVERVKNSGEKAYLNRSIHGIFTVMRAGAVFETEGTRDTIEYAIGGAKQIQLWHGMGFKNIVKYRGSSLEKHGKFDYTYYYSHDKDYWMVASDAAKEKYQDCFNIPDNRMFVTGQPKDDTFVNVASCPMIEQIRAEHSGCKILVYLPTHRKFGNGFDSGIISGEALADVDKKLKEINVVMIFKPHFHEFKNYENMTDNFSNIILAFDKEKYGDVYEFLPSCDGLITDYSGIMFGYLASQKPIILFPYDKKDYVNSDAGFCYDYDEVAAGPQCYTWDEVITAMKNMDNDGFAEKRKELCNRFEGLADGKSCERIYKEVCNLLNLKGEV